MLTLLLELGVSFLWKLTNRALTYPMQRKLFTTKPGFDVVRTGMHEQLYDLWPGSHAPCSGWSGRRRWSC